MAKIIGGIVAVVLVIGGYMVWQSQRATAPTDPMQTTGKTESEAAPETMMGKGRQMVSSIKDAMGLGTEMQCTFTTGEGATATTSTVYVVGEKFMTTATVGNVVTRALFDGETQYVWMDGNKQGMKMTKTCLDSFKDQATDASVQDYRANLDMAKNVQCEPVESDPPLSMQTPPKDVTFTDQCAMMQESLKMMEQYKDKLPAGMTLPTQPNAAY